MAQICAACGVSSDDWNEWIAGNKKNLGPPPSDLKNIIVCKKCYNLAIDSKDLENKIRSMSMKDIHTCRACDVTHNCVDADKGKLIIFQWMSGNTDYNVPGAPADLRGAWICRKCYEAGGAQLEKIIREADSAKKMVQLNDLIKDIVPIIVEPTKAPEPKEDYWTRPISSLYKTGIFR